MHIPGLRRPLRRQPARRFQSGLSMVESLLTTLISGLLLLAALPGLMDAKDKRRIDSLVAQIETELQYARSEAVARGETVRVGFVNDGGSSCYVVHTGSPRQCTCLPSGRAECVGGGEILRSVAQNALERIHLTSSAREIGFDPTHGTVTPTTTLRLENPRGDRVHLVVNIMGRMRTCSPNGGTLGHAAC